MIANNNITYTLTANSGIFFSYSNIKKIYVVMEMNEWIRALKLAIQFANQRRIQKRQYFEKVLFLKN